jgi:hypothetical protein
MLGWDLGFLGAVTGTKWPDVMVAAAAVTSVIVAVVALIDSRRALREANVEAYPVTIDKLTYLGMQLRNFGPRHAKDVRWAVWIRDKEGRERYRQSLRLPILAIGERREVVIGFDYECSQKRSMAALAKSGGMLISEWSWHDGRQLVFLPRNHREHLELVVSDIADGFIKALERQPDETLEALSAIRTAIDGVSQLPPSPPGVVRHRATRSVWIKVIERLWRERS